MTPSRTLKATLIFVLCLLPQISFAESLSENIAALIAVGRNLEITRLPPRDSPAAFEFQGNGDTPPFGNAERPIAVFKFGFLNLTAYANARPSLSVPLGDASLGIKTTRDSIELRLKIPF